MASAFSRKSARPRVTAPRVKAIRPLSVNSKNRVVFGILAAIIPSCSLLVRRGDEFEGHGASIHGN